MNLLPYNNENLLINFHPLLRKQIEELLLNGKMGLKLDDIIPFSTKQNFIDDGKYINDFSYYFILKIPYGNIRLSWKIIFNPDDLKFAPDFDFNDDTFLNDDINFITENVPSLVNWNVNDPKCLSLVLQEFKLLFKQYHIDCLKKNTNLSVIKDQFETLEYDENYLEVFVDKCNVTFTINIDVDCSDLPDYIQLNKVLMNPGDCCARLKITFTVLETIYIHENLYLSPHLEQILNYTQTFKIPSMTINKTLSEYVESIKNLLNGHVMNIKESYKLRKEFICNLVTLKAGSIIEFDSETFFNIVLLYVINNVTCLVYIQLTSSFPLECPIIKLQDFIYSHSKKIPLDTINLQFYNPKLNIKQMIQKILESIDQAVTDCSENE